MFYIFAYAKIADPFSHAPLGLESMLTTLAIENYRSLLKSAAPLRQLNIITGPNGSGKSNLYRALRLLADTANGGVVNSLAKEGGLGSTFWAGPETLSRRMKSGEVPVQGGPRNKVKRLKLGFSSDSFGYSISLGYPTPSHSAFSLDPEIKRECIWAGEVFRPAKLLIDRSGPVLKAHSGKSWEILADTVSPFESIFSQMADPAKAPELSSLKETIRSWRFYDHFRADKDAPARLPQLGTRTPVLSHDGHDMAAALQTILEVGNRAYLNKSISEAFPGAELLIDFQPDGRLSVSLKQHGLLRPLSSAEFSDGTLRYLLWIAALLTPRPPSMMVLNEPETSLHPDLLPSLSNLIRHAAKHSQVWVVSHSQILIKELKKDKNFNLLELSKEFGETNINFLDNSERPVWYWPD